MNAATAEKPRGKFPTFLLAFVTLPLFLLLTVIFWEIVLGIGLLSDWFYADNWRVIGAVFKLLQIIITLFTIAITGIFVVTWFVHLFQTLRAVQPKTDS